MNANNIVLIHSATGTGPIAEAFSNDFNYFVKEVRLTLGAGASDLEDFSITIDSRLGEAFDHEIGAPDSSLTLTSVTSFRYADQVPPLVKTEDKLAMTWPNADGVPWAIEVLGG